MALCSIASIHNVDIGNKNLIVKYCVCFTSGVS